MNNMTNNIFLSMIPDETDAAMIPDETEIDIVPDELNATIISDEIEPSEILSTTETANNSHKIPPQRLVMIKIFDNCHFCCNPKGNIIITYISIPENFGFISCNKCINKAENAKKYWFETQAFGPVKHLKGINLNIKRSNGTIEDGWVLNNDIPTIDEINNELVVNCINYKLNISRWCLVDNIIEMNPSPDVTTNNEIILPQKLTFNSTNKCFFCKNPEEKINHIYISVSYNFGFISCNNCIHKAEHAKKQWIDTNAFGPVKHLQSVNLNIKRSNGKIENGWKLNNEIPMINNENGITTVNCINETLYLTRWCSVDSIIELNPCV